MLVVTVVDKAELIMPSGYMKIYQKYINILKTKNMGDLLQLIIALYQRNFLKKLLIHIIQDIAP